MKEWTYLGEGRNRAVYQRGSYVVKVPLREEGIADNYHEARVYKERRTQQAEGSIQYARCRLLGDLLVMEYAMYPGPGTDETGYLSYENGPDWMAYVDCGQVGYNRRGQVDPDGASGLHSPRRPRHLLSNWDRSIR